MLEVGVGEGLFTNYLISFLKQKKINTLECCEYNKKQAINISKKYKVKCYNTKIENLDINNKYDIILLSDILEHVDDPIVVINKCKTFLRDSNSHIIIFTPNALSLNRLLGVEMGMLKDAYDFNVGDIKFNHNRWYDMDTLLDDVKQCSLKVEMYKEFFLKPLSNAMMKNYKKELLQALYNIGIENCAELMVVCHL